MPSDSFDTFFACTIIVAAALIATAFLGSTLHARITSTQDINKDSYLRAIADRIATNPGTPVDWGTGTSVPQDFGLAQSQSSIPYELDIDKISRLNSQNNASFNYAEMVNSAKLNSIAFGLGVTQIISIGIEQIENHTVGSDITFTFQITTNINSKPTDASLQYYVVANNYLTSATGVASNGYGEITVQAPSASIDHALLVLFARNPLDDRITAYSIYNFATGTQQSTPNNTSVTLSMSDYTVTCLLKSPNVTVQNGYVLSYNTESNLAPLSSTQFTVPKLIEKSPLIILVYGVDDGYFQEWTAYPQIPLTTGSNFEGSEQNIFSYVVTINGVLYRLNISLGDVIH
jgi:hypothetical protein